jgi:hypothetical protein
MIQAEVRGQQGLANVLDDVLPVPARSVLPNEGLAVAVGDEMVDRLEKEKKEP